MFCDFFCRFPGILVHFQFESLGAARSGDVRMWGSNTSCNGSMKRFDLTSQSTLSTKIISGRGCPMLSIEVPFTIFLIRAVVLPFCSSKLTTNASSKVSFTILLKTMLVATSTAAFDVIIYYFLCLWACHVVYDCSTAWILMWSIIIHDPSLE